jgi:hypothetical protein
MQIDFLCRLQLHTHFRHDLFASTNVGYYPCSFIGNFMDTYLFLGIYP